MKKYIKLLALCLMGIVTLGAQVPNPSTANVVAGKSVTMSVTIGSGTPPLAYQWQKSATDIPGATNATFLLPSAQVSDSANYRVTVSNAVGSATSNNGVLNVFAALTFTQQPQAQTVTAGSPVTFGVGVTGTGTYQWQKNGVNIAGATATTYSIVSTAQTDAGVYAVIVTNPAQTVTSSGASLTVNAQLPPVITGGVIFTVN